MADYWSPGADHRSLGHRPEQGRNSTYSTTHALPPHPPPARTMSSYKNSDPRMKGRSASDDQRKRPLSHSPEPGRPTKHLRPGLSNGALSPRDASATRSSSISNGTTRATAQPDPTGRSSTQFKADVRREADRAVRSPASPYRGSGSGHSTTLQTREAPATDVDMNKPHEKTVASASNSVLVALQNFASQVATQASLEITGRHAEHAYERAKSEYSVLRTYYSKFPALEEKKSQSRERAYGQYMNVKKEREKHVASQQNDAMETLAKLIADSSKPVAENSRTDVVSRAEYDALAKKHDELRREHNSMSESLNTMQDRLNTNEDGLQKAQRVAKGAADATTKSIQGWNETSKVAAKASKVANEAKIDATETSTKLSHVEGKVNDALKTSQDTKDRLDNSIKLANGTKQSADEALQLATSAQSVFNKALSFEDDAAAKIDALRTDLEYHKTNSAAQFALKKDAGDLEAKYDTLAQGVAGIRKGNLTLRKEVEQIRSAVGPSESSMEDGEVRSQEPNKSTINPQGGLVLRVAELEQKYDPLRAELNGLKGSIRVDTPSSHVTATADTEGRLAALEKDLENTVTKGAFEVFEKQSIKPIRDDYSKLQAQITEIQTAQKHQRQNSMPAPQASPPPPQSPQLLNGISSLHGNGTPQSVQPPQGQPSQPPSATARDIAHLNARIDGIIIAQQHLKQRADNMTSDDIVKSMCDQFSTMYPDAKNFNSAHKALTKRIEALNGEIQGLKQVEACQPGEVDDLKQKLNKAEQTEKAVSELKIAVQKMEGEVEQVKTDMQGLGEAVAERGGAFQALEEKVKGL